MAVSFLRTSETPNTLRRVAIAQSLQSAASLLLAALLLPWDS